MAALGHIVGIIIGALVAGMGGLGALTHGGRKRGFLSHSRWEMKVPDQLRVGEEPLHAQILPTLGEGSRAPHWRHENRMLGAPHLVGLRDLGSFIYGSQTWVPPLVGPGHLGPLAGGTVWGKGLFLTYPPLCPIELPHIRAFSIHPAPHRVLTTGGSRSFGHQVLPLDGAR